MEEAGVLDNSIEIPQKKAGIPFGTPVFFIFSFHAENYRFLMRISHLETVLLTDLAIRFKS